MAYTCWRIFPICSSLATRKAGAIATNIGAFRDFDRSCTTQYDGPLGLELTIRGTHSLLISPLLAGSAFGTIAGRLVSPRDAPVEEGVKVR